MTSIFGLQVDQLWAIVSLLGDGDGIVVGPVQVVDLGHDGDQSEQKSGSINVAGIENNNVGLSVSNRSHTFEVTCSSEKQKYFFYSSSVNIQ